MCGWTCADLRRALGRSDELATADERGEGLERCGSSGRSGAGRRRVERVERGCRRRPALAGHLVRSWAATCPPGATGEEEAVSKRLGSRSGVIQRLK
jgi:hypothetical protein